MSFLSTKGAEGASFLRGAEQACRRPRARSPGVRLGVGGASCSKGEMILSSKQEMVTRRPGAALNDLQLSSQKKKKKVL